MARRSAGGGGASECRGGSCGRGRCMRLAAVTTLVAMALDLTCDLVHDEIQRVQHLRRGVTSPQGDALEVERRLSHIAVSHARVWLPEYLELQAGELGDLAGDLLQPALHMHAHVVGDRDVTALDVYLHQGLPSLGDDVHPSYPYRRLICAGFARMFEADDRPRVRELWLSWICSATRVLQGPANTGSPALLSGAQALENACVPRDRADQNRPGGDVGAWQDDAVAQLRCLVHARTVAQDQWACQAHVLADLDVVADPHESLDLSAARYDALPRDDQTRGDLAPLDLQAQLAAQRVEGALAQLGKRADVIPVLAHLVHVERDVVLEQGRKHILSPVHEWAIWEIIEDLRLEDVDAAVTEV